MANAVENFEVPEGDDLEISEAEIKTIECELNELLTPTNGDDKEECCLSLSPQVLEEQPDVTQIIQSVAKITWTEAKGKFFGSGFLAKITLGVEDRLGFFTAGHNLYDKGTKQLVKFSSVQLRFKDIQKQTKKIALSKFLGQKHVLIVAYKTCKIISRNGQESTQPCQKGLDFGAVIFTAPVDSAARFLSRLGLSYLQVASPGACSSAPKMPVQLVGFPKYIENSPMRILPGNELEVPQGNIPDHCYDMETETGASGGSVLDKGGSVVAVHIRGQNIKKGDQGNWGLGFDIIREELQLCLNIPSLPSQAQPGTSDPVVGYDAYLVDEGVVDHGRLDDDDGLELEAGIQGMPSVVRFLKNLKLDEYISAFEEHHIDMEVLEDCEPEELEQMLEKMEVSLGHSNKIKKALKHEKQEKKKQMKKEQEREEDQLENIGVNETAAASNVKMSCGVIIMIIGIVIAVIAVIANYYLGYKGGELSCPSLNINTQDRRDVEELKSIESAEECSNKCREKTTCKFWTWHHKDAGIWALDCVLMSGYGYANSDNNVISGSRTCNPGGAVIVSADEGEAAEHHGSRMGLYRPLDGSSYQQVGGSNYIYQVLPERVWCISEELMKKTGFMCNPTESSSVPASGWKYSDDGVWRDDPELSVRMLGQELQCNTITITCSRDFSFSDFRRIKNDVLNGHPVFRNSFNHYLRVATGTTTWSVSSQRDGGDAWLQSGRVTSCPAHPNSGKSRRDNQEHWRYVDGIIWKNWVEDPTFVVTCNDTVKK